MESVDSPLPVLRLNSSLLAEENTPEAWVSWQSVEVAIRLLQITAAAGHYLQENRLYKSFRLLERVRDSLAATATPVPGSGARRCAQRI
jgi:hypothetical protein